MSIRVVQRITVPIYKRPLQCTDCQRQFSKPMWLKKHQQRNENITSDDVTDHFSPLLYVCIVCGAKFQYIGCYNSHCEVCHTRAIWYFCHVCGLRFRSASYRAWHLTAAHDVGQPEVYRCKICNVGFPLEIDLHTHLRSAHPTVTVILIRSSGVRQEVCIPALRNRQPFCRFCGKIFRTVSELQCHTEQQHLLRTLWAENGSSS